MKFYRAIKRHIKKGYSTMHRYSWRDGECLYFKAGSPLMISDTKTSPPFKTRNMTLDDFMAKDWV